MEPINSRHNPRLKELAALRERRGRERGGLILVDGAREIGRALGAGLRIDQLVVCEALCAGDECRAALDAAMAGRVPRLDVTERAFASLAYGDRSDGLIAVAEPPPTGLGALDPPAEALLIVLEGVEKPGNLGAVLRSADGAGADALILADPIVDLFNPNVIRASLGTVFTVPIAAAPTAEVVAWLALRQVRVIAARVDGRDLYTEADLRGPLAIVLGSEAHGLSDAWRGPGVTAVRLPMRGVADSLNVSVAAAVLLYEARRQR